MPSDRLGNFLIYDHNSPYLCFCDMVSYEIETIAKEWKFQNMGVFNQNVTQTEAP